MIDSQTAARGVEMTATPRLTLYTKNSSKWSNKFQNGQKLPKVLNMVKMDIKWSKLIPKGPNWSNMV